MSKERKANTGASRLFLSLAFCGILVVLCYYFLDRPVAWFFHSHRPFSANSLERVAMAAGWLNGLIVVIMIAVLVWRLVRRGGPLQTLLLSLAASLLAAELGKDLLKWAFG